MLALFPLDTVLFPGCSLDLQVFEPRYLDMISRCLRRDEGFGVVAILEGREVGETPRQLARIGCEARVRDWQQLANGLLGVRVEGVRRFRFEGYERQPDGLLLASASWCAERSERPLRGEDDELLALYELLAGHPAMEGRFLAPVGGMLALGDRLGDLLPLARQQKIQLLEMDDPAQRLAQIQGWLETLQDDA